MASRDNQVKDITKVCVKGSAKDNKYRLSKIKQWETLYDIILPELITKVYAIFYKVYNKSSTSPQKIHN